MQDLAVGISKRQSLILLVGNIGVGKSTWITNFMLSRAQNFLDCVVINADNISTMLAGVGTYVFHKNKVDLYQAIKISSVQLSLDRGYSVIVDGTHLSRGHRKPYIKLAKSYEEPPFVVVVDFGPGNEQSLGRRLADSRGISAKTWMQVHDEFRTLYEKPHKVEGISQIQIGYKLSWWKKCLPQ